MTWKPEGFSEEIFKQRYAYSDAETWDECCLRVAKQVSLAEESPDKQFKYTEDFYNMLVENYFVPGGRILYNAGRPHPNMLNCFVLRDDVDSAEGWGALSYEMIVTSMRHGGCGINFSQVRPKGADIAGQKGKAPGALELMKLINNCGHPIKAGGQRRVALMFALNLNHPDILDFVDAKINNNMFDMANISVLATNTSQFIDAVRFDRKFELSWKGKYRKQVSAKELWEKISTNAYNQAEPGFLNWELAESESNTWYINKLACTNPCGEIAMEPYGSCCLGHLVLPKFLKNNELDYELLANTIRSAVRFLDNVLTVNHYPLPEYKEIGQKNRRIGLGTTGLADLLIHLGYTYGSDDSIKFIDSLYRFISKIAYEASVMLAIEKGAFPNCDPERHILSGYIKRMTPKVKALIREHGIRNCAILTQAPTGCQHPNTLVYTNKGILTLGELVNQDSTQWQLMPSDLLVDQESALQKTTQGYVNGITETRKIRLASGIELEASLPHQYRVYDNVLGYQWKSVQDLVIGDKIVSKIGGYTNNSEEVSLITEFPLYCNTVKHILPATLTTELSWFLGLFYADGSVHTKGIRIALNAYEPAFNDTVVQKIQDLFDIKVYRIIDRGCESIYLNSQQLLKFLQVNKLLKPYAHLISIPRKIRESSTQVLSAFIDGYFHGDGHYEGAYRVFDTVSSEMAQQLASCLRALGQNCTIQTKYYTEDSTHLGRKPLYRIKEVSYGTPGQEDKRRYLLKEKQEELFSADKLFPGAYLDTIVNLESSECMTLDIEVPNNHTYIANSVISHNTVSILSGNCSSGIEPVFAPAYERRYYGQDNEIHKELVFHPLFVQFMEEGKDVSAFIASHQIDVEGHLKVQATVQKHVDNAVSKTVNLPKDYPLEDLQKIWLKYLPQLKGCTFYRAGSRSFGGGIEEPLKPFTITQAIDMYKQNTQHNQKQEVDCSSGVCML